ncbi:MULTISPECIES: DUF192 domain-containing protein [Pelosinus]|jgi:uncharacterized membrane protein (UPF0127 family)|uniref:DUF192 domain-containing protein n=1 Tax=Pelosinus fermentans B4 TaxID=1149862 RepID=I8RN63_9FIRM|nr:MULTISPECIES: DUF192 domain-containing protein [Pelosinus]EIW20445.1 protein of unknown function DUF192 [Pelosinus fermentans B4]EIW25840.1 protein of unknown function DUF192 [Pelosinus fermentans A11]OAM93564.1 protein of unknown function DUF192 [Pelosinus fermentans DSM 17108]SDQ82209.1 hypothetical protein SAMN04515679_1655 [Pelosinus fermentans]
MRKIYLSLQDSAADNVLEFSVADTFLSRLKGLLGTTSLAENQGLLLCNCNSVHMIGMRYVLDIVYLDKNGVILKIVENLKPWQVSCCWSAKDTLEVKSGTIQRLSWKGGDQLQLNKKGAKSS